MWEAFWQHKVWKAQMILAGTYLGKHASKGLRFSTPTPSDQKKCHFSTNSI